MPPKTVHLENIVRDLPDRPGVYQYYDKDGKLLYVGKAKNLKKRVSSYFTRDSSLTGKVKILVQKIADIRFIVVDTELDALLLENNLIKQYQPRYNVMLKDDKTYPWICIKNEPFPRVLPVRNLVKDGSEYFGPYASVRMMNTLLDLIRQLYPLRTCTLNLSESNIRQNKYKVCLEFHLGNCKGPCEGLQLQDEYLETLNGIRQIIRGNIASVRQGLIILMKQAAAGYEFEKAQFLKEKIELLDRYQSKSAVVNPSIHNVDVFSYCDDLSAAYVNFMKVINGCIIQSHTIELKKKLDESPAELLSLAITELRERFQSDAREIIIPFAPDVELQDITTTIPLRGDKKALLELSERNAKYYRLEKNKQLERVDPERHTKRIMEQMQSDLRLKEQPLRIECFDNSNIQGAYPVASMVVFTNGKPDKQEYRHFNIKTVEGPDDYASMEEVIYRRYKRVLEEGKPLPQLIVIDGGKGQLGSAMTSLGKLGLRGKIEVIGIAKKLEEIFKPGDPIPLYIDKKSETLRIIQQIRDEAHRFGITHHRKRREKGTIKTQLTEIEGIGMATAQSLLRKFRSVKNIGNASLEELQAAVGKAKASVVYEYFRSQNQ
ncbi:MAG TPA: excinuclease ABC subunit UvrC [Bacteroidales bacterium]|nr:excinuclease ABC subunit UvrC [Bacteroidales bacterium]HPT03128.1 excinuclease ABC subunit UvrC [Bacteroidales bacterium]